MPKKRDRLEIICDMLISIQNKGGKIKPTHLMYKANLAHRQLKVYLEELIKRNFIKKIRQKKYEYIIITDKGSKFVQKIKEMRDFEDMFGF